MSSKPPDVIAGVDFTPDGDVPGRRPKFDWDAIASALEAHPNQWALIAHDCWASVPNAIRKGSVQAVHPDLGFEVMTRNTVYKPQRKCSLYMRYAPASSSSPLSVAIFESRKEKEE